MQENLTILQKYATMDAMLDDSHILEHQKAYLRQKIQFHKKNVLLQSALATLFIFSGIQTGQRKSVLLPLVFAPSAALAVTKLKHHEKQRRQYKKQLNNLERN